MTLKAAMKDWVARLAGAKSALGELHSLDRQLREQYAAAKKERDRIANLPPPLEEIITNMETLVDAQAVQEAESLAYSLRAAFGGELELQRNDKMVERLPRMPNWVHQELTFSRLCALAPAFVKERWAAILRAASYESGTPLRDRARLVAEVEDRITKLEREHEELVEEAARLDPPVTITFLTEVKERREREAERRKREAATVRARTEAEARVELAMPTQQVTRSPYLQE